MNKILIICSSPMYIFNTLLEIVKNRHPNSKIIVLANQKFRDQLAKNPTIEIISYSTKKIGIVSLGLKFIKNLRKNKYAIILFPYDIRLGIGSYLNICKLLIFLRAKKKEGYGFDFSSKQPKLLKTRSSSLKKFVLLFILQKISYIYYNYFLWIYIIPIVAVILFYGMPKEYWMKSKRKR